MITISFEQTKTKTSMETVPFRMALCKNKQDCMIPNGAMVQRNCSSSASASTAQSWQEGSGMLLSRESSQSRQTARLRPRTFFILGKRLPSKAIYLCRYWVNSDANVHIYPSKSMLICLSYILQLKLFWQTKHECSVGKKSGSVVKKSKWSEFPTPTSGSSQCVMLAPKESDATGLLNTYVCVCSLQTHTYPLNHIHNKKNQKLRKTYT